ncbi:MAG TPA: methyl-accepting chemotaxis protein [Opitutaceae bacterium]|nr:methyl-accepting chemotaxis protein [Opitutaceae bacterium]
MNPESGSVTPEHISELAGTVLARIQDSINEIGEINLQARILSFNAELEAARAGEAGRGFAVVSKEMAQFSVRTSAAARTIEEEAQGRIQKLASISRELASQLRDVRGTRLCDLAAMNIDFIDRNLYERSCDVRWWATDASLVAALENRISETAAFASHRLSVILKAYTVYFDIVLADLDGVIIANGTSDRSNSIGTCHRDALWFTSALATANGNEFGFHGVHSSTLVDDQRVLVYSSKVCHGGDAQAEPIGVLGIVFNWDGLAQKIMNETPDRKPSTRICIVDEEGLVLADTANRILQEKIEWGGRKAFFSKKRSCEIISLQGSSRLIAHAQSPGFETYRTGWHSLIIEDVG